MSFTKSQPFPPPDQRSHYKTRVSSYLLSLQLTFENGTVKRVPKRRRKPAKVTHLG